MTVAVSDVMSTEVRTVARSTPVKEVVALMREHHIRHLPVVDDGGVLQGLITDRDLQGRALGPMSWLTLAEQDQALTEMTAMEVMTDELITGSPGDALTQAAGRLVEHEVGCLPIIDDDGRLAGILTESDFVRYVARSGA